MSQEIFICYRRKDVGGYAGRLFDHLTKEYGPDGVLFDVEVEGTAELLTDWVRRVVPESALVLALIGDEWIKDRYGRRRLEEQDDIVRLEIELALSNEVPIIPVLIDGAAFPSAQELPESMQKIADFKGYEINNSFWEAKLELLLQAITSVTKTHVPIIRRGVSVWNSWRFDNIDIKPKLEMAQLAGMNLEGINLADADLRGADLHNTCLVKANLSRANLSTANLTQADLEGADIKEGILARADLTGTNLRNVRLYKADLSNANLNDADLTNALLEGSLVFGVSVWNTLLGDANQSNLRLGSSNTGTEITVDSIQMAVVIHLLLTSGGVREMIDTVSSKTVLILGRFTADRRAILETVRDELRKRNFVPMLFDFEKPQTRDLTETISLLAHMSRFIVADITDARSIPQELMSIVPNLPSVPIVPLREISAQEFSMFSNLKDYPSVIEPLVYGSVKELAASIDKDMIAPVETRIKQNAKRRRLY